MSTCRSGGVHALPATEESWDEPDADALMAACLAKCVPCQDVLVAKLSREPGNDAFGRLFTTFVVEGMKVLAIAGITPRSGTDLFKGRLQRQTRQALAGVSFPAVSAAPAGMVAMGFPVAADTAKILARMSRQDRAVVLNDVLDMVCGAILMRPFVNGAAK